jgi:hypothetical protein
MLVHELAQSICVPGAELGDLRGPVPLEARPILHVRPANGGTRATILVAHRASMQGRWSVRVAEA